MVDFPMPGQDESGADIAIIGMAGRFPGARNVDEFWQNVCNGVESITRFSDQELLQAGVDPSLLSDPNYVKAGAILEDIDMFDANFFGFTPKEAQILDPQHRLFIETVWNALEGAGYNPETYKGSIGLYAGSGLSTYFLNNLYSNTDGTDTASLMQVVLGNDKDSLTTRVAYLLNLTGPCFTVQTYCSTSLVATSIACSSLLNGECDMALAGGVLVSVPQKAGYYYQEGGIASPDGRCRAFDAQAKGSPLGNGVAVVVLKRLEDAIAEGDTVHAVIKGSAINNDGSLKVGYTAPGVRGQAGVIVEALANAGVEAESIGYIEAHGTGTPLGDAAELNALIKSFADSTDKKGFCAIGSAKTNVGHLDRAAGVTGLIKTALAVKHGLIPPSLNYEEPNPQVDLHDSPFYVNTQLMEWKTNGLPRRAGVSAFGIGGTNAHVVLEEPPVLKFSVASRQHKLLLLSARTESALETATANLRAYLQQHEETDLADVAYTLQMGRKTFEQRRMVVCRDREEALQLLGQTEQAGVWQRVEQRTERPVAFVFPGVGEQYGGMAQQLYEQEPLFRAVVERCCDWLQAQMNLDLRAVLFPSDHQTHTTHANGHGLNGTGTAPGKDLRTLLGRQGNGVHNGSNGHKSSSAAQDLKQTAVAQPAVFVIEYALAQLLLAWGIRPQAMLGYSLGEYVAACIAGVFSLEDALTLVAKRAQLIAQQPQGAMLAVALSEEAVQPYLNEQISLAIVNGPTMCVLAGPVTAIEQLESGLSEQEIAARRVETSHAFHSKMLEPVRQAVEELAGQLTLHAPQIPYLSNVTGTWITAEQATDPAYWATHMCQPVRFDQGVQQLLAAGESVVLEVGVGQSLSALIKQHPSCGRERFELVIATMPAVYEPQAEQAALLTTLGKLWLAGVSIEWNGYYAHERRQRVCLPTYPFERQRYWIDPPHKQALKEAATHTSSGKKRDVADWFYQPVWEQAPLIVSNTSKVRKDRSSYLVFLDSNGPGPQVVERLRQEGHAVVCVLAGDEFSQLEETRFTLQPGKPADYQALCKALSSARRMPTHILHLWNVTPFDETVAGPDYFKMMQERGFYSLLFLAQALGIEIHEEPLQLTVVSNHVQNVTGQEQVVPEKATLLASCKVIAQEYQDIKCRSIDLVVAEADRAFKQTVVDQLLAECSVPVTDPVVAYRDDVRWIQTYQPLRLKKPGTPVLRHQGVYLITGGLGGVGLVLAEHLTKTVQAKLVLVGRSGLPARENWDAWLEQHEAGEGSSRKIERIRALEALGAEVLVVQADVADVSQMAAVIRQTDERFGCLNGIIHAAGIVVESAFRPIQSIGRSECEWHFEPKVYGTYALAQVLAGRELDFCVLFSSLSSVLGGLGFVGYTAANIFMDAFVTRYNQTAIAPWISVNWDTWQVSTDKERRTALGGSVLEYAMNAQEGIEAFERILVRKGIANIVNSTGDLQARIRQWILLDALTDDTSQQSMNAASVAIPKLAAGSIANRSDYEQKITQIWQQVLGIEHIGLYDNFFDLGGNSLSALQVLAKLKKTFQVQLPIVALFEASTIRALVNYLLPAMESNPAVQPTVLALRRQQVRQAVGQQEIAIIAMSGRFPGAATIEQFWLNLRDGVESVRFFSDDELLAAGVDPVVLHAPHYVKARPILEHIEQFDAAFFGYSPREAALTDPQHRLFLECAWEAVERAGYDPSRYEGLVGVFAGTNLSTYLLGLAQQPHLLQGVDPYQLVIGNDKDGLPTSVSYKFNLKGPSLAVQTFCSTSLVAVHLAAQSLRQGECDLALAGGVSIRVPTVSGHLYQEGGMESPDGHCRTFDAQAKGGMFGDGVGVVVLKRLSEALEDGDQVLAVLKGSAINNDGALKVSYTAPSVVGQAEVVQAALGQAGVSAESISYVEAHGTATELGDPIEVASLTKAFRRQTQQVGYCALGSVKTNIGHLDRAAGVSGLIKTVLALQHRQLPPSLHFQQPNPAIDFANSPFWVNTQLRAWESLTGPRRAGINSLGMGGTNAHVVLEEAAEREPSGPSRPWQLLLLSARTEEALTQMTTNVRTHMQQHPGQSLADVAYTLQVGRKTFEQRRMLVCRDQEEALRLLEQTEQAGVLQRVEQRIERSVAFVFPGVGEQYAGMAQELYEQEPLFRQAVERCCDWLQAQMNLDLRAVLFPPQQQTQASNGHAHNGSARPAGVDLRTLLGRNGHKLSEATERLKQTAVAQPAVFVIEYALAQLLMQWGIRPHAMLGYSLGEYVAACIAGVFSLEDALTLVAKRAQLIAQQPQGAMLAVALSEEAVQPYLNEQISLAIVNGPAMCVLGGPVAAIEQVEAYLNKQEIATRRVETTHAFHSKMLEPVRQVVADLAGQLTLHAPQIPYLSNVTGTWITAEQATDPGYWAAHLCQTVRFEQGVQHLLKESECAVLEVGIGQSLSALIKQHPACGRERFERVISTLPSLYEPQVPQQAALLKAVGQLWLAGVSIEWSGFYAQQRRQRVCLPTYPFERQRYWIETTNHTARPQTVADTPEAALIALKREEISDWFYLPGWRHSVPIVQNGSLNDKQCWLFLLDECGIGRQVIEKLVSQQQEVITVMPGKAFGQHGDGSYVVNPIARADYVALLKELRTQGKAPRQVVHCWTMTPETTGRAGQAEGLNTILERGLYSLLALTQAVGDMGLEACQMTIISNNIQDVTGSEQCHAEKATILGPCRVIPLEYPTISCRSIDICVPASGSWQEEELVRQLVGELTSVSGDAIVALRNTHRWVQAFEPVRLTSQNPRTGRLRDKGVYLITGGLGGIGLAMAEHLARTVQARLVLTTRKGLPPRSEWAGILQSNGDTQGIGSQIRKVLVLEELGAEVLVQPADVSNETQMSKVIQQALTTFGTLHGVLHAAGVPGIGLMQLKTPEMAASVLSPKVMGTLVLERVLKGLPLDFLVLFSSITSTTGGGPGQMDYCAANAFLDAYARQHFAQHGITIAVDWGEWKWNAWEAGLTGYDTGAQTFFRENRQRFGIAFEEGAEALTRILSSRLPQVVVSTQDFRAVVELSKSFTAAAMLQKVSQSHQSRTVHPRPNLGSSYIAPKHEAERKIAAIWEELLGISQVGTKDNFFELGGNSLIGINLIARLRKEFAIETIPTYVLYEAPTVSAMAHYLEQSKSTVSVEVRHDRGEKRRESLKQRMREPRSIR